MLSLALFGCGESKKEGPREIYYGSDLCERCSMIISEKPYAAQYLTRGGGVKKFDDLGCMVEHIKQQKNPSIEAVYVRDYETQEWIDAKAAFFVKSTSIKTPMGHGIVAFRSRESAENLAKRDDAKLLGGFESVDGDPGSKNNHKSHAD